MIKHTLEPAAQEIADATAKPPFLYELGANGARKVLDDIQAAPIAKPDVEETWITVPAEVGDVAVRIVKPTGAAGSLPAVLYVHGGGWILGNAGTHAPPATATRPSSNWPPRSTSQPHAASRTRSNASSGSLTATPCMTCTSTPVPRWRPSAHARSSGADRPNPPSGSQSPCPLNRARSIS